MWTLALVACVGCGRVAFDLTGDVRAASGGPGLDPQFGSAGIVRLSLDETTVAYSVAIDARGRVIVGGVRAVGGAGQMWVARLTRDGVLDQTFAGGAPVRVGDFGGAIDLTVDTAGRIVAFGWEMPSFRELRVARLLDDGSRDATLATATGIGCECHGGTVLASTRIVAVGLTYATTEDSLFVGLEDGGTVDTGFGAGGFVQTDFGGDDRARAVVRDGLDRIWIAGGGGGGQGSFIAARLRSDGSFDPAFAGGMVASDLAPGYDEARAIALHGTGVVLAGESYAVDGSLVWSIARYTEAGVLDSAFGQGGFALVELGVTGERAYSVVVDDERRTIVAGGPGLTLLRLDPAGQLDATFAAALGSSRPWANLDPLATNATLYDCALAARELVCVGEGTWDRGREAVIARVLLP